MRRAKIIHDKGQAIKGQLSDPFSQNGLKITPFYESLNFHGCSAFIVESVFLVKQFSL